MTLKDLLPRFTLYRGRDHPGHGSDYSDRALIEAHKLFYPDQSYPRLLHGTFFATRLGSATECESLHGNPPFPIMADTGPQDNTGRQWQDDIGELISESYEDERIGSRIRHGWNVMLADGQRLVSPKSFDKAKLDLDQLRIESQMRKARLEIDPLTEASRANRLSG